MAWCYDWSPAGFQTSIAFDAMEAARMLLVAVPQAIVLDVRMPDGDGLKLLDWIRSLSQGRRSP